MVHVEKTTEARYAASTIHAVAKNVDRVTLTLWYSILVDGYAYCDTVDCHVDTLLDC